VAAPGYGKPGDCSAVTAGRTARAPLAFFLPSLSGGGAERAMVNLATGFAARGIRTDFVLARAEGPYLALVPPAIRIIDLNVSRVVRAVRPLAAYLRRERPAAMLSALNYASLVAIIAAYTPGARTRTVISIQNTLSKEALGVRHYQDRAIPLLLRLFHHRADSIVAVSRGVADDLARVLKTSRARIDVIHNPVITPALFAAAAERPAHSWFEDATHRVILGVGRLTKQKNFPALIEAFALVKRQHDVRLVILGEGPERPALEALIRQHGLQDSVALPGFVDNPYACMARASVFVLSSDFEGLPTVLIESLAVGTPVVSTDCDSGPREILDGGALGELVPVGDVRALALAIARTLAAPTPVPSTDALRPFTLDAVVDRFQRACHVDA
jgi:glycosyltransferase involved in cell wall biosynthesis